MATYEERLYELLKQQAIQQQATTPPDPAIPDPPITDPIVQQQPPPIPTEPVPQAQLPQAPLPQEPLAPEPPTYEQKLYQRLKQQIQPPSIDIPTQPIAQRLIGIGTGIHRAPIQALQQIAKRQVPRKIFQFGKELGREVGQLSDLTNRWLNAVTASVMPMSWERKKSYWDSVAEIDLDTPKLNAIVGGITAYMGIKEAVKALGAMSNYYSSTRNYKAFRHTEALRKLAERKLKKPQLQTAEEKIIVALERAVPARAEQEAIYTIERGKRIRAAKEVGERIPGQVGFFAKKSKLKGKITEVDFEGVQKDLNQKDVDDLFKQVQDNRTIYDEFDKVTAGEGLMDILSGKVPTEGKLKLLNHIFSPKFMQTLMSKRSIAVLKREEMLEFINIPKAMTAGMDMSAPLRQGAILGAKNPKQWFSAFFKSFKYFFNEQSYHEVLADIKKKDLFKFMVKARLHLPDVTGRGFMFREEMRPTAKVEHIPLGIGQLYRMSNRAYTGFLSKFRADVFEKLFINAQKAGRDVESPKFLNDLGNFLNVFSGRGRLPKSMEKIAPILNAGFFSPRLIVSRLQILNPQTYISKNIDPFIRKEAVKTLAAFITAGTTAVGVGVGMGGVTSLNRNSPDFMKIRFGNTRLDPWGGLQQFVVLGSRVATLVAKHIRGKKGRVVGIPSDDATDILKQFVSYKVSPPTGLALSVLRGKTAIGKPLRITREIAKMFIPLLAQDLYDLYTEGSIAELPLIIPAGFGVGISTYRKREEGLTTLEDLQRRGKPGSSLTTLGDLIKNPT